MRPASDRVEAAGGDREKRGGDHAPADGFAVQEAAVAGGGFERVAERVAEIQYLAQAAFAFVGADDPRLDGGRARNDVGERGGIAAEHGVHAALQEFEELCISDDAVLDDFIEARAVFAVRKSTQRFGIGDDEFWRIERADEVLSFRKVDTRLAANRAIDLRDERRGNVD